MFGTHETVATLRRLDNQNGNVQIRYESKRQAVLRDWLRAKFPSPTTRASSAGVLEFVKVGDDAYRLVPASTEAAKLHLCLGPSLYHNGAENLTAPSQTFSEVSEAVSSVAFRPDFGQAQYNDHIRATFVERGWLCNEPVIPGFSLRFDFKKDDYQVEVEFGNARSYYQDYLKFLLPFTRGLIRVGVLLVPTSDFAQLLCALGTRRAVEKATRSGRRLDRLPKYSGMITYEKVEREFGAFRFMLNMPLVIRGIDFWGQ